MAYVLKIKFESNLRRLTLQKNEVESESFTFAHLESRILELFQLPATAPLAVTYTDEENDIVTMGNDQDLKDALVQQALNPLRIHVTLSKTTGSDKADTGKFNESDNPEIAWRRMMGKLSVPPETVRENIRHVFQSYEPLLEGLRARAQISGWVENALQTLASQATAAVRNGAAAASGAAAAPGTSEAGSGAVPAQPNTSQGPHQFGSFGGGRQFGSFGGGRQVAYCGDEAGRRVCYFGDGASSTVKGADSEHDSSLSVHYGVICDTCGVSPILGNRWKSKEKVDYDLCHSCFEKHGKQEEYSKIWGPNFRPRRMYGPHRIGHPFHPMGAAYPPPPPLGGRFGLSPFGGGRHHCGPMMGPCSQGEKLHARFVCDVTIFDGTEVAPGTQFVKIWRLRNSGTAPWPVNTILVFAGGDELGHALSIPVQIPEQGVAPEAEMEVSVDMVAPQKPGRYVSHWRLASPAGPRFGQRLSVTIQVVPKTALDGVAAEFVSVGDDDPAQDPEAVGSISSQTPAAEPADEGEVVNWMLDLDDLSKILAEQKEQLNGMPNLDDLTKNLVEQEELNGMPNLDDLAKILADQEELNGMLSLDDLAKILVEQKEELLQKEIPSAAAQSGDVEGGLIDLVGNPAIHLGDKRTEDVTAAAAESSPAAVEGSIPYPVLDVKLNQDPITYPVVDPVVTVEPLEGEDLSTTKALLGKLEAMGFTDSKLNAELLEKNGFDLRKTLDDLCAAEEWDPILEQLEEMGFYDTVMNRRLMFKNNGSVKRVVKELVEMYRDIQEKREKVE